jgi:hypothetical protein
MTLKQKSLGFFFQFPILFIKYIYYLELRVGHKNAFENVIKNASENLDNNVCKNARKNALSQDSKHFKRIMKNIFLKTISTFFKAITVFLKTLQWILHKDINDNILGIDFMHTHKLNYN